MNYHVVLWDFDGTLVDTSEGIFESLRYALQKMGVSEPETGVLRNFIGPPMLYSFQTFLGFDAAQAQEAVKWFRADYETRGIYSSQVYSGLKDLLGNLRSQGVKMGVATLKPERMAKLLLRHFGLEELVGICVGTSNDERSDTSKTEIIRRSLQILNCTDHSRAVLVGDTIYDEQGAKEAGIAFLAAAYGFGIDEERVRNTSIGIAHNAREIGEILGSYK